MDISNSSPDQGNGGEKEPSEMSNLSDKYNNLEPSDHVPLLVSEALRLPMLLLPIAVLVFVNLSPGLPGLRIVRGGRHGCP